MADAVFILSDQLDPDPQSKDNYAVLLSKMIQDQVSLIKIYVQLVRPISSVRFKNSFHTYISTQTVKMGILGTALLNPGFSTLMGCLHTTSGSGNYSKD